MTRHTRAGSTAARIAALAAACIAALAAACIASCTPTAQPAPPQPAPSAKATPTPPPPAPADTPQQPPSKPTSAQGDAQTPIAQLNAMDTRRPVPLQPMMAWHQKQNMMEHLVAIERITAALAREDWPAVAEASASIGSSPEMAQMCEHMGAGAEGFTALALEFHKRADAIGVAAKAKDGPGVLRATSHTLQACTQCHATFRQDVVDAETWQARTGSTHNPASQPASNPASSPTSAPSGQPTSGAHAPAP